MTLPFDPYDELEISHRASQEVVEAAYRRLARRYHPDSGEAPDAERMVRLNRSFAVLGNPVERDRYERAQRRSAPRASGASPPRSTEREAPKSPPAPSAYQPSVATWWERNQRWVIGLAVTVLISWLATLSRSSSARDSIRTQNDAARLTSASAGTSSGSTTSFSLRIGDCISDGLSGAPQTVRTVHRVGCSDSDAQWRVGSSFVTPDMASYPTAVYFQQSSAAKCPGPVYLLYPSPETWQLGDRTVSCLTRVRDTSQATSGNGVSAGTPSVQATAQAVVQAGNEPRTSNTPVGSPSTGAVGSGTCAILNQTFSKTEQSFLASPGPWRSTFQSELAELSRTCPAQVPQRWAGNATCAILALTFPRTEQAFLASPGPWRSTFQSELAELSRTCPAQVPQRWAGNATCAILALTFPKTEQAFVASPGPWRSTFESELTELKAKCPAQVPPQWQ